MVNIQNTWLRNQTDNDNYLAGAKCPKCKSSGPFTLRIKCTAIVSDNGLGDIAHIDWNNEARCLCLDCGYSAKFGAFKNKERKC